MNILYLMNLIPWKIMFYITCILLLLKKISFTLFLKTSNSCVSYEKQNIYRLIQGFHQKVNQEPKWDNRTVNTNIPV